MKYIPLLPFRHVVIHAKQFLLTIRLLIAALIISIMSGFILFALLNTALITGIIQAGFDPQRAQFTSVLILTVCAALVGATFTTCRSGAILGAELIFVINYLIPFVELEIRPVYDAGGHSEPLNTAALVHTIVIMLALGILSAFIGAAIGSACYDVLIEPPLKLVQVSWNRMRRGAIFQNMTEHVTQASRSSTRRTVPGLWRWAAVIGMIVILVLVGQSTNLFEFTPEVGLHTRPQVKSLAADIPVVGTTARVTMVSKILGNQPRSFMIYLPPTYNTAEGKGKHYPTLYLLHGSPGTISDWINAGDAAVSADTLIDTRKIPELIMIMPDGNSLPWTTETSEWGNSANHRQMIEIYVCDELVSYVDHHYRTIPNAAYRAIGGLSMGGFGAMNIAIHHPDIFGSVISLGGYFQTMYSTIWGNNQAYRQYNSPLIEIALAPRARQLHIFLGDATQDQPYYLYVKQFMARLKSLHMPYTFVSEPGHHAWKVWADQLYQALQWLHWSSAHTPPRLLTRYANT
jgi:S-formylglutathione hydrolase FrmB